MKNFQVIIVYLALVGCNSNVDSEQSLKEGILESSYRYKIVPLDTVYLETQTTSFIGYWFLTKNHIHFIDRIQSKISQFDHQGNFKKEFLGKGDGPDRQNGIYGIRNNGQEFIILSDTHISIFDSTFILKNRLNFDLNGQESYEEMLHMPRADMFGLYEIAWIGQNVNTPFLPLEEGRGFILPLQMTHPELNGYWTKEYYESVATFGFFDGNYKLQKLGGKRSDEYLKYNFLPNFDFLFFTEKKDTILVSFPIDPEIHIYDGDFNFKGTFGEKGKSMKTDYIPTQTLEEAESQWEMDLNQFGHYDHIFYDPNENLLFRSYLPEGKGAESGGLQIYKGNQLIADLVVPVRFKVLGSVDGVFFADGIVDEENETLGFYKFRLNEK